MKKLLFLILILTSAVASAQKNEGIVLYEVKMNMHRRLPADRQEMKTMIPEFRTTKMQLIFNQNESLFKNVEEDDDEEINANGGAMRMRFMMPQNELYFNFAENKKVEMREFMTKKFLLEGEIKPNAWKISDEETKEIKGYLCKKATFTNEERKMNVVAWFTEQIPVSAGPDNYNSLMGLVLQVDINDGEIVTTASNIEFKKLKKGDIKIPTEGKKITQEEFRKMVEEQMKQMGGNGMRIFRN